ncbi:hypothetical protein F441_04890 [Phytophthora nicotianae CJ01A1]|uniref:Uncharacterized protein n=3 Tax=Phytophthora nicotianae TaxID=4792 RepID=W2XFI0_PHYNI|nr:hypothetical protein F444_04932 [Phytophthora nicotianae P1976]ETP21665.1 hypothetical protein F441_04890 [Phytophthora nicotianae CJ01A1]
MDTTAGSPRADHACFLKEDLNHSNTIQQINKMYCETMPRQRMSDE